MRDGCVFCDYAGPKPVLARLGLEVGGLGEPAFVIEPLEPVTHGHRLLVPNRHVADALEDPELTGQVFAAAARYAARRGLHACNLITSVGREATQTVFHLHVHVVPRVLGDGLSLPWPSPRP